MTSYSIVSKQSIDQPFARNTLIFLGLLIAAFALRAPLIGEPAIHVDEEFYLLVADRMWHGALPYVDIWDRKPILLFLIYAALRPFSPEGIVSYQIGATLFATATAYVISLIARRFTNPAGASLAGLAYLIYLPMVGGMGGQAPVFYNLFMALGALEVVHAGEDSNGIWRHGLRCMFWVGLAIQVKYLAAIEGMGFGIWLVVLRLRQDRGVTLHNALQTLGWIAVALVPTLLAFCFYALIGHAQEFVQANFLSIFQKHAAVDFPAAVILSATVFKLAPLLIVAVLAIPFLWLRRAHGPVFFLLVWTAFAIAGFFSIGNYYDHYALPLLVPFMIVCAPIFGTPIGGSVGIVVFLTYVILDHGFPPGARVRLVHDRDISAMVEAAQPYAARGCLYIHDGPSIVYLLTHSCLPSRFVFPGHLSDTAEAEATDATRSMESMLATHPSAILAPDMPSPQQPPNAVTAAMLAEAIARDYQPVATIEDLLTWRHQILYARKDLLPPEQTPIH